MELTNKLIDWRLYDPAGFNLFGKKNNKACFTTVHCTNSGNCEAYKKGRCVVWSGLNGTRCPYGDKSRQHGFTARARKYHSWIREKRDIVEDIPQLKEQKTFCIVGDYVFVPYPHWTLSRNIEGIKKTGLFSDGEKFIPIKNFTAEFFQKLVVAMPIAIFGGIIRSYQKEVVPKMVLHLEENLPEVYKQWVLEYPDTANKFEVKNHVGRKAYVKTLKKDCIVNHKKGSIHWDGEKVTISNFNVSFSPVQYEESTLTLIPKENATIEVTSNDQVCATTEFAD